SESLDYEQTLQSVLDLAVAHYCEHAILFLGSDPSSLRIYATAHRDPARGRVVDEIMRHYVPNPANPLSHLIAAVSTGSPVVLGPVTDEQMAAAGVPEDLIRSGREVRARSGVILPLVGMRGPIGALSLTNSSEGRPVTEEDVEFAMQFAERVARAIENATLYRDMEH